MNNEHAAGASAARHKLAAYFAAHDIPVRSSRYGAPPSDDDFLKAVLATVQGDGTAFGPDRVMVLFKAWHSNYQVVLPAKIIESLKSRDRYDMFTASSYGGWNTYYLARVKGGPVKVHRRKHWRTDFEVLDTTLLYPEDK